MQKKTLKGFVLGFTTAIILGGATLTAGAASGTFKDIKAGAWYEDAILWAQEKRIVSGYPDGTFKPNGNVTRAELTGVVQNLAKEGYIDTDLDRYERYEAIKIGKTTKEDLIKMFGEYTPGSNYGEYYIITKDLSISVTFNNDGTVRSKSGVYPPKYPQVTEQNLKKLESGMSYEQVSVILGGKGMFFDDMETKSEKSYGWSGTETNGSRSPYAYLVFDKVGDGLSLALDDRSNIIYK
ncbi:S-layer homology domain-containing protein [Lysinibacillus xylanilyticus]|uniref:S-layer homology domain-containing protein n=1 Tax=Lysinibacillus xylanilyticus TaxID=582475 RepID=UPI002B24AF1F|nr:S-layer homology domain-containing protein [Lysinibacillus xylanilyticus]MEB2301130.1 S-layer homology domain-containing protein [Lysinibacillus xylanilyticus]